MTSEEQIQHIRFATPDLHWVCTFGLHEYFREVTTPSNKRMQPQLTRGVRPTQTQSRGASYAA
jgi:hypothetical protein